jgi:trk system potassium uptake protein TrkA
LSEVGHEVTIVDRDPAITQRASEQYGLVALVADATEAVMLREAEIGRADVVVAMLRRDADNLAVALLARAHGVRRVMVRMRDKEYRVVYLAAGVDRLLSETEVFVGALATAIEHEAVTHSMMLGNGESVAFEIIIPPNSVVAGKAVSEVATQSGFPSTCVFAGLYKADGTVEGPRGASIIQGGMTVLLVARRDELRTVIEHLTTTKVTPKHSRAPQRS